MNSPARQIGAFLLNPISPRLVTDGVSSDLETGALAGQYRVAGIFFLAEVSMEMMLAVSMICITVVSMACCIYASFICPRKAGQ